jgi:outer membrane protein assembly factor BamB
VESAPALASDGTLHFGCDDAKVYALDSSNGTLQWYFPFSDGSDTDSSPALGSDGTVYIGSDKGILYALQGQQGYLKWSFQAVGEISGAPAIGMNGAVTICALNAANTESVATVGDGTAFFSGVGTQSTLDGLPVAQRAVVWAHNGGNGVQKWEQWLEPGSAGATAVSVDGGAFSTCKRSNR